MKYIFTAKDIETGNEVSGDLAYMKIDGSNKIKPMIVTHRGRGGYFYITSRYSIDESTIKLTVTD